MKKMLVLATVLSAAICVGALADTLIWTGTNSENGTSNTQTNVNDASLWFNNDGGTNRVPIAGDRARIYFDDANTGDMYADEMFIKSGSTFAPSIIDYSGAQYNTPFVPVYQLTNMTVQQFNVIAGASSGGIAINHWRVGSVANAGWLTISATDSGTGNMTGNFTITGPLGAANFSLAGTENRTDVATLINAQSATTGVNATGNATGLWIRTVSAGSPYTATISNRTGAFKTQRYHNSYLDSGTGWDAANVTLDLADAVPITMTGSMSGHRMFYIEAGSKITLSNASITLKSPEQTPWANIGSTGMGGTGRVEFTAAGGTVALETAGRRSQGTLGVGNNQLAVRSDQTWTNSSGLGFMRMNVANGQNLVSSLDGAALNNLDLVPFFVDMPSATIAHTILPGEYGGLHYAGTATSGRLNTINLSGNATVKGFAIHPGNDNSTTTATLNSTNGLILTSGRRTQYLLNINGNKLTVEEGVRLVNTTGNATSDTTYGVETTNPRRIDARGSQLVIGGDLEFYASGQGAGNANATQYREPRNHGIMGNATTVITVGGSFKTNVRSLSADGLHQSTVNLVGGLVTTPNTFEVGSDGLSGTDGDIDGFVAGTYAIGTLNIGDGVAAGFVKLVNDNLNDGDNGVTDPVVGKSKVGEALMATKLNIKSGSTLDVNAQYVYVSSSTLDIAPDAWLDLNTGLTLTMGDRVTTFIGLSDQEATWDGFAGRVKDTSNPGYTFDAVLFGGNTYWQAIPEPGTAGTLVLGVLLLVRRRRRLQS